MAACKCHPKIVKQQRYESMFKKLLNRFFSESRKNRTANRRRRASNRQRTIESLEPRQLYAADSFVGVYDAGTWRLDGEATQISFGLSGDQPVMGDWNGDGKKTPGVFRNGMWVLDETGNGFDGGDRVLYFGLPGDKAIAGDWDGDGKDTVGIFRNGNFTFDKNGNGFDAADSEVISFGWATDIPVAGDWNGDGKDTVGIYRDGTWVLDLTGNGYDTTDRVLQFGLPRDQPVVGDWNGDGKDTPGVLQNGQWFFDREGNGYTGETGTPNQLGNGTAVSGSRLRSNPTTTSQTNAQNVVNNALLKSQVSTDHDDTISKAINLGTVARVAAASGVISTATDVDMFKVYLRKGTASFDIDTKENGIGGLGSYIRIFDANGRSLGANNDGQAPDETPIPRNRNADREFFDSYLSVKIPADGWYYVGVSNWQNTSYDPKTGANDRTGNRHLTGAYQLTVTIAESISALKILGTNGVSVAAAGRIVGGRLNADLQASDTVSQDKQSSQGKLSESERSFHQNRLSLFLKGETPANSVAGRPTQSETRLVVEPVLNRFLNGSRSTLTHDVGSELSKLVQNSKSFKDLNVRIGDHLQSNLQSQVVGGQLNFTNLNLDSFVRSNSSSIYFNPLDSSIPFTLRAIIGGTQGLQMTVKMEAVTPKVSQGGGGTVDYQAKIKLEIFDVFGAGNNDRYIPPLESMWQLQHRGSAQPFVNRIVIETIFKGSVNVPKQFNSTVVA
jgi:hypothetical protein